MTATKLSFELGERRGWSLLTVGGEVDIATAGQLRAQLDELASDGVYLALDLTQVGFMDSTGLGVLVATSRSLSLTGGRLAVVSDQPSLTRVFEITSLGDVMHICPSIEDLPSAD